MRMAKIRCFVDSALILKLEKQFPETKGFKSASHHVDWAIRKLLEPYCERTKTEAFTEAQENALKEIIRKVIVEMDSEGFWDHTHNKETGEIE